MTRAWYLIKREEFLQNMRDACEGREERMWLAFIDALDDCARSYRIRVVKGY